ncbi:hypothetical protein [Candidatus Liberibacter solanacearum]|uniref:hypothetical protein n=1 Tax=Candidatus Liberibacter solanacearum TaxID=556287 RepID=UPI003871554C
MRFTILICGIFIENIWNDLLCIIALGLCISTSCISPYAFAADKSSIEEFVSWSSGVNGPLSGIGDYPSASFKP